MPQTKRWLRGDPLRPFPKDIQQLQALLKQYVAPTHEPLWFYRNRGSASPAEEARAINYLAIENIERARKLGLHMPKRAHFYKGFGLQRERPWIDQTVRYARELHKRGLLVSVYVGGTIFTDYFFREVPEARAWCRVDQSGGPITYGGHQLQRWFPCLNNPGYRAYTKRVLDVAASEIEADEIFFDNQILRYEPRSCRCPHCVQHLRDLIRRRYTLEQCEQRYGLPEYPDVVPPVWSQACPPWRLDVIHLPQLQDWIEHRIESVVDFYRDMAQHVKKQRPTTAVGMNIKGIHGHNTAFDNGISHAHFADILDYTCIDGYSPGKKKSGAIQSEIRLWKSSHQTHISVIDGPQSDLPAVEGCVYGYRKFIPGHGWLADLGECPPVTPVTQFLYAHQRLYHERRPLQDVAVLRSESSTNYNCATVHEQLMAFEQTLCAEKIPWGIIFDGQMDDLAGWRIIALPEIQAVSDAWLDRLDAFMRAGGGVIASGAAASFDHWYRAREPRHALERWLGRRPAAYEVARVGKGRFVYVPRWEVATKWDFHDWFGIWGDNVLPVSNRALFLRAIDDATVGGALTFRVTGPEAVWVEAIEAPAGRRKGLDLHFINYDREKADGSLAVRVALPDSRARRVSRSAASVQLIDPHQAKPRWRPAESWVEGGTVCFNLPVPDTYGVAQVTF